MSERSEKSCNFKIVSAVLVALLLFVTVAVVHAKDKSRQRDKSLDEQVHSIKSEVLAIAKELDRLEKKLLYPSNTQISIFISLRKFQEFSLDSIDIEIDGKGAVYHLYTPKEMKALNMGGVQRIYTGNIATGKHELKVTMRGKTTAGNDIRLIKSFPIEKKVEPGIAELMLAERSIIMINR